MLAKRRGSCNLPDLVSQNRGHGSCNFAIDSVLVPRPQTLSHSGPRKIAHLCQNRTFLTHQLQQKRTTKTASCASRPGKPRENNTLRIRKLSSEATYDSKSTTVLIWHTACLKDETSPAQRVVTKEDLCNWPVGGSDEISRKRQLAPGRFRIPIVTWSRQSPHFLIPTANDRCSSYHCYSFAEIELSSRTADLLRPS